MKILAIGDIIGQVGIKKFLNEYSKLKEKIDFCIVNAENAADGFGLLESQYKMLSEAGVDVITMGDHTWGKKDIFKYVENSNIIRPANLPKQNPGKGYVVIEKNGKRICAINIIGRTFMNVLSDNPFECMDKLLSEVQADYYIVDFHAEATAEKIAMSKYLDGRVSIIYGTHTHVQTADEQILEKGTGYITDLGMTGPKNSVIGMDIEASLKRFTMSIPERYKLAEGEAKLNGCIFEIDDNSKRVISIERIIVE